MTTKFDILFETTLELLRDTHDLFPIPWFNINKDSALERREHMRKLKVYLNTSVVSYLHQEDAPERMKDTPALWDVFRAVINYIFRYSDK